MPPFARSVAAFATALAISCGAAVAHDVAQHSRPEMIIPPTAEYDYVPPEPGTYSLPRIKAAPEATVLDTDGAAESLRGLIDGKITVLAFIYTRCADICPSAMQLLHDIHSFSREDTSLRTGIRLITVSFDPEHDTPAVMAEQAELNTGFGDPAAEWRFLTTSGQDVLRPMLEAYGQPVARVGGEDDLLAHQLRIFLVDASGDIRNIYSLGFMDVRLVMSDIRTLLLEAAGRSEG